MCLDMPSYSVLDSAVMTTAEQRLGNLIRARRRDLGLYTVVDAARRADISRDTLAKVEVGERAKPVTYRKLEQALDWAPGSIDRILDGGDPAPAQQQSRDPVVAPRLSLAGEIDELRAEIQELRDEIDRLRNVRKPGERSS